MSRISVLKQYFYDFGFGYSKLYKNIFSSMTFIEKKWDVYSYECI